MSQPMKQNEHKQVDKEQLNKEQLAKKDPPEMIDKSAPFTHKLVFGLKLAAWGAQVRQD